MGMFEDFVIYMVYGLYAALIFRHYDFRQTKNYCKRIAEQWDFTVVLHGGEIFGPLRR